MDFITGTWKYQIAKFTGIMEYRCSVQEKPGKVVAGFSVFVLKAFGTDMLCQGLKRLQIQDL